MLKSLLITVTDYKKANHNALKFMIASYKAQLNVLSFDNIVVLYPEKNFPQDFREYLIAQQIETYSFDIDILEDTYKVKLLLIDFVRNHSDCYDSIFYIDPDHLFIKPLTVKSIIPVSGSLYVSSEVVFVDKNIELTTNYFMDRYYNTSIIFGSSASWLSIIDNYSKTYEELFFLSSYRHREEIAFTIASKLSSIALIPVPELFQSNFKLFNKNCIVFHYGGESDDAHMVKKCMSYANIELIYESLIDLSKNTSFIKGQWVAKIIVELLKDK
ncbi:MAG TPA: hypothetical protein PLP19_14125 [bacterium]|mgnify:CR=1 FL=1|nr:hypothetical protein [bacterium]HPN44626.1 hypothetical protein [bacterium]